MQELRGLLESSRGKRVVITFHTIGDRDAVGSAVALSSYFTDATVVTPNFITSNAKHMLSVLGLGGKVTGKLPAGAELVIVCDANNTYALASMGQKIVERGTELLFIDHHALHDNGPAGSIFNDEGYNSTASIVYDVLKSLGAQVSKKTAVLLLNGIVADSADLQNASSLTFRQIAELLEIADMQFSFVVQHFKTEVPLANKYRVIKDVFSANVETVGKYLLVYGTASEHANVVADAALRLDCDASVFWAVSSSEASLSARLRAQCSDELHVHLGVIMEGIGPMLGGEGGGHACAAGAYGPKRESATEAGMEAVRQIKEKMLSSSGKVA
jgi:nanoRNase/pAp phosphatase (c-di-AMP/oligoRNAs hydrolase)